MFRTQEQEPCECTKNPVTCVKQNNTNTDDTINHDDTTKQSMYSAPKSKTKEDYCVIG